MKLNAKIRILHLEDSVRDAELIQDKLEADGLDCQISLVDNQKDFAAELEGDRFDIILCDYNLPNYNGMSALELARKKHPDTPIMLISGSLDEEEAVKCLQHGATDYLLKQRLERLVPAVKRALNEVEEHRQRQLAAMRLRESDERFRQITENTADFISLLDLEGRRIYNNPAYVALLDDPLLRAGSDSFQQIHPDDRQRIQKIFADTARTGISQRAEYRFIDGHGKVHHIESQGSVVHDAEGKIINILVVGRDISERKQAEEQIREQAALLDKAQDAIYVRDLDQHITYWNKGAERLYGWTAAEVLHKRADELYPKAESEQWKEVRRHVLEDGEWMGELRQVSKAGKAIVVESRRTLLRDERGKPKSILIISTDITDRKQAEVHMLRAQRLESIGTLAGGVAHDLNNALAPILMATDLLRMQYPGGTELIDTVEASAQRGADMVRQLLTFAKGVEGARLLVQPEQLLSEIERIIKGTFPKNILLKTRYAEKLEPILGDETQLHQVLLNLCVNARDSMPNGGTLTLESDNLEISALEAGTMPDARPGNYVLWRVSDTGTGIPPEIFDRIFEPFFSTKSADRGTGLGLSTILGIVQSHFGFVRVNSEPGQGSTFSIYLPVNRAVPESPQNASPNEKNFRGNGETILVVDDESPVRDVATDVLESLNFRVLTASNGNDALMQVADQKSLLRAIITDLHMPNMDGLTFARAIKFMAPAIPIIVSSGRVDEAETQAFETLGIVDFLDKPFTQAKLSSLLQSILED